jgi:hypothetical protein
MNKVGEQREERVRANNETGKTFESVCFDGNETPSTTHERPDIVGIVRRGDPGLPS